MEWHERRISKLIRKPWFLKGKAKEALTDYHSLCLDSSLFQTRPLQLFVIKHFCFLNWFVTCQILSVLSFLNLQIKNRGSETIVNFYGHRKARKEMEKRAPRTCDCQSIRRKGHTSFCCFYLNFRVYKLHLLRANSIVHDSKALMYRSQFLNYYFYAYIYIYIYVNSFVFYFELHTR